ncbi:TMEM165/GDT1 family protein [Halorhabdus amylolytica]|uniref:TMEM165/GDT1 family protein n=1 Tax=Halorhabdus amylolytica TaxID=2559573 RepID=UPI0010AA93A9|nr:TMEM165/GDT1 family protein [Halorhabdus amylolytica]
MSEFLEIVVVAFAFQLAVLPGEKVQFIIAGLSTRYHPLVVVSAAGSAFAGWTALEIVFGEAIKNALPELYLDAFTAGLFLLFAALMIRSAPEPNAETATTDGGVTAMSDLDVSVLGYRVPALLGGWLPIFAMMAAGEFGDKTQLVTIGLAADYGATSAIWVGEMLAIIPVSLLNAYFFHRFAHLVNLRKAHFAGAAIFTFFAADTVLAITADVSVWETIVEGLSNAFLAFV